MSAKQRFEQVYRGKWWASHGVLSGNGSRPEGCRALMAWLSSCHAAGLSSICDLGCGDVEWIARVPEVADGRLRYHGIDAVPAIIKHHRRVFPWFRGESADLEAVADERAPGRAADIVILKDVLFHLCNGAAEQVLSHVSKWQAWKMLLVSTHAGAPNHRRRGLKGAGALPYDAEAAMGLLRVALNPPVLRFPRPDGGEWIVWERPTSARA